MELADLQQLIAQGESNTLELKKSTSQLRSAVETLCAFINNHGGTILIGVKDNHDIIGQHVTDKTRLEISNMLSKIEPPVTFDIEYFPLSIDKYVIKITAEPNPIPKPYVFDGKPFWRIESSTRSMPQQYYQNLLMERANKFTPWESLEAAHITMNDLDHDEIIYERK